MCPRCGASVQPDWNFCRECGYSPGAVDSTSDEPGGDAVADPYDVAPPPPPPPPPPPSLSQQDDTGADPFDTPASNDFSRPMFATPAPAGFDAPPPSDFGGPAPSAFDAPPPSDFDAPSSDGFGSSPSFTPSPSSFDGPPSYDPEAPFGVPTDTSDASDASDAVDASDAGGPGGHDEWAAPSPGLPPPESDDNRFGEVADAVADDAPMPRSSPFRVNRVVAVAAVVLGAVILIGGIVFLTGNNSKNLTAGNGQSGSTLPPIGALTPRSASPTTLLDPLAPASTTTTVVVAPCDSPTSVISPDGKEYTPCGGGFKVDFPGRPDTRTFEAGIAMGKVKFVVLSSTQRDYGRPIRLYAAWGDLPKAPTPEEANDAMAVMVQKLKGTMGNPTTFQDQPAISYAGIDQGAFIGIVFVRGAKVFALEAESSAPAPKDLDRFKATFGQL